MAKFLDLATAVAQMVHDGDVLTLEQQFRKLECLRTEQV